MQAIVITALYLNPSQENGIIKHDYEYKSLGTVSLLVGIDLIAGGAIPLGSPSIIAHNQREV